MWASIAAPRSLIRLFLVYAAVSLVPVLLLGALLADYYGQDSRKQGLAQGRSEAALVAETAIEPLLTGHPLSEGLTAGEQTQLQKTATRAVHEQNLIRVRVRDLQGLVVFSDDGSGFTDKPDGEALEAARGVNITRLTHLNSDSNDTGQKGVKVVEVYLLLRAGEPARPVGVLEVYLPYSPIERSVTAGLHALFRDLVFGLTVLWLVLFGVCVGVTGGLRRQVRLSTFLAEHDALTDLPNRTLFRRRIKETLAENDGEAFAVAIVDLDRFKEINDTLGHVVGDRVLIELGRRLDTAMPAPDFVARLGGDEF
ncbi:MAG: Phytochrome-like protein cph2, partial [Actinomycetia bacterium]|nr:Phytochrome-like protein cph2 [Actinomycetes bacterium]